MLVVFGIFLLIWSTSSTKAQNPDDFERLHQLVIPQQHSADYKKYQSNTGTFQVIFSQLFLFYKHFFSSQDANSCPFEISCSVYFIESVRKYGVVKGFLNGFDRYMRCNGLSTNKYQRNSKGKLIDPN